MKPLGTFACYHARKGWERQEGMLDSSVGES